jgi:hypothetical protein
LQASIAVPAATGQQPAARNYFSTRLDLELRPELHLRKTFPHH